jgi:predicted patatin/cPLA2 family phospholipase
MDKPRRALVVQGGGMRGAYAAGAILEIFRRKQRFDGMWATSSGAASCAYGLANQPEGIEIWQRHLHGRQLLHPVRLLLGRSALDLDYLVDDLFGRRIPLDVEAVKRSTIPLIVPVTNVDTGEVEYFDARGENVLQLLRAAMAVPGAVVEPIALHGKRYVDGGVIDQLPIAKAIADGAKDIVVVTTRPAGFVPKPVSRFGVWVASRRFPAIRPGLKTRQYRYAEAIGLMEHPPPGVRVRVIRHEGPLRVSRFTTSRKRLLEAINDGAEDARRALGAPLRRLAR